MKIDFSQQIMVGDEPVTIDGKPTTFGQVCRMALNAPVPPSHNHDRPIDVETMVKKGKLAIEVAKAATMEISPEDVSMIRACLPNQFSNAELVAIVYDLLDPTEDAANAE